MKKQDVKKIVKESYEEIAEKSCCCSCSCSNKDQIAKSIGYTDDEVTSYSEANLGLGCGNPTGLSEIKEGMVVLDLGSGAGFDCFLAAKKVGKTGKVIGVDMTENMIKKARENAKTYGYDNVEFLLGDIENLPVPSNSIDLVISNCVINLAPDKKKVFTESHRVLKKGGKMVVSDIVLLKELSKMHREDKKLIAGCVGGALLKDEYLKIVKSVGFTVKILSENTEISKEQYQGFPLESLLIMASKI